MSDTNQNQNPRENQNNHVVDVDNIVSQIYQLIQLVNSVGGHENFLQTFRDVEKKIFHHVKAEISRQRRDAIAETEFIISGISGLVKRLRSHKKSINKIMTTNEKVKLRNITKKYAETCALSDEVRRVFETESKNLSSVLRDSQQKIRRAKNKLLKNRRAALDVDTSSSSDEIFSYPQ